MESPYKPIDCSFHDGLLAKATRREYCKIQYFTEIREFLTVSALIKDVYTQGGEEFMLLSSGEIIRLDRVVSVNGVYAPAFSHMEGCGC